MKHYHTALFVTLAFSAGTSSLLAAPCQTCNAVDSLESFRAVVDDMADTLQPEKVITIRQGVIKAPASLLPRCVYFDNATHHAYMWLPDGANNRVRNMRLRLTYSDGTRILAGYKHPEIEQTLSEDELRALDACKAIIRDAVHEDMTSLQKVLFLHDALAHHASYDYGDTSNQSCTSMMAEGIGACGAYARSMRLLLGMLGIPQRIIQGSNKDGSPHCWGLVQLEDGHWYHLDVTKDDDNPNRYQYFCVTDQQMSMGHNWEKEEYPDTPVTPALTNARIPQFCSEEAFLQAAQIAYRSGARSYCARLTCKETDASFTKNAKAGTAKGRAMRITRIITTASGSDRFVFLSFRNASSSTRAK